VPPPDVTPPTLAYLRPLFHEEQHFRGTRVLHYFVGASTLLGLGIGVTMMLTAGRGAWPALAIVAFVWGLIFALVIASRMTTVVDAAGVHVRYFPFLRKTFRFDDIAAFEAMTYDPIEYGGWGVRGWPDRYGWAYNVRGNRGVRLAFRNGHRLMLGSQRADELARAIEEAKREILSPLPQGEG
jgi:hypothetical protein